MIVTHLALGSKHNRAAPLLYIINKEIIMAETTPVPTGEACFLCKSGGWSPVYDTAPYRVVKCDSCGLLRIAPMPDDVKSREINEDTYSAEEYRERYFKDRHNFAA